MIRFLNFRYFFITLILAIIISCAYYNTFFNAEENYRIGLEKLNQSNNDEISKEISSYFEKAISKSWNVIKFYGDSNSWADDALLLIGKSHYNIKEYKKSQEVLEQFLQKYLKSPLRSEAELWLAQALMKQGNTEDALKRFSSLIAGTEDQDILSEAYFNVGEIYFDDKNYDPAINNFQKCINISSSGQTAGNAQYKLADSYFNKKDYEKAVVNYKKVLDFDLPVIKQLDAVIQMSNSLIKLNKMDEAREMLLNIMNDQRFKDHYSMIATKLANMLEFQGDIDFAVEKYKEVLEQYPKSEGAALASFYLAQIYEFDYGWLDSAKTKYADVKKIYPASESVKEANERDGILTAYLKIKEKIIKDKEDLYKLEHGDSLLIDSLEAQLDTIATDQTTETTETEKAALSERYKRRMIKEKETGNEQPAKAKKIAVTRKPEEVKVSLLKNSFNLAEFFLLTYQHYDSARIAYTNFIKNFSDSLLTPKAYYSLYYIFNDIEQDSIASDSVKNIILTKYPDTVYGKKLSGDDDEDIQDVNLEIKDMFLNAEHLVDLAKYNEAIKTYNRIAEQDSGSEWALKARYASAYIYENYLNDIPHALDSYTVLAKEYPLSEQGKIALQKIAAPPEEKIALPDTTASTSASVVTDSLNVQPEFQPDSLINDQETDE